MKKFFFLILFNLIFFSSSFSTERENELNNLFKKLKENNFQIAKETEQEI